MGALDRPAAGGLHRGGHAPVSDGGVETELVEQVASEAAVVPGVQVSGDLFGVASAAVSELEELRGGLLEGRAQQRGVVPVRASSDDAQRDAPSVAGDGALQSALAPVDRGRSGCLAATGGLS
jgi:hypothetical protein